MIFGSIISLMDQNHYGHLMIFMINILSCSGLCIMTAKQSLISIFLSSAILIVGLPFFQHSKNVLAMHYFNLVLFIPICIGIFRVVYSRYRTNYTNNQLLKKQTSINKIIIAVGLANPTAIFIIFLNFQVYNRIFHLGHRQLT